MIDWMDYGKIHEYKRNGLKKSQVARRLEVDYKTILKYWDMSPSEYAETAQASKKRRKKADEYKDFVVKCLTKYPDMSATQVYDWIKERTRLETMDFQKRAFRNYVQEIRKEYGIKKPVSARDYEAVDELPMGQQAQVDMGEIKVKTATGRYRKVYCFAMVLAHSRYKFIFNDISRATALYFWEHYPSRKYLKGMSAEDLREELVKVSHNRCGAKNCETIISAVATDKVKENTYQDAKDMVTLSIVSDLRHYDSQLAEVDKILAKMYEMLDCTLTTIPGVNVITAVKILAEIGDIKRFKYIYINCLRTSIETETYSYVIRVMDGRKYSDGIIVERSYTPEYLLVLIRSVL